VIIAFLASAGLVVQHGRDARNDKFIEHRAQAPLSAASKLSQSFWHIYNTL